MTANEIRAKFLDFFASKGHKIVESDSVVPKDDPTVLFTTAGMQQFKKQFLGYVEGYTKAATSQKCLRTDDLDKVGKTAFHHTFFEMLGNFSFGDYFKKEAITWAWEFLTHALKIPSEKLWVSVYKDDDEAYDIWLNNIKIKKERIVKLGDKSNFWPSEAKEKGPNGPCGPCSEIFYDYGVNPNCPNGSKCDPDCSCGRFSEVWNLVFTQFNRKEGGVLEPLPNKNIDTGMGLERLVAVVQGKKNNYETDLFEPIISAITQETEKENCKLERVEKLIIADHLRAIVFGICDGVIPSNEGRGYIVKKLIIDSTDLILQKGVEKPIVYKLIPSVIHAMKNPYPEIAEKLSDVATVIKKIEEGYIKLEKERIPEIKKLVTDAYAKNQSLQEKRHELVEIMFKYRDTFGLTLAAISKAILETSIGKDELQEGINRFPSKMDEQKERSRASSKMTGDVFAEAGINLNVPKTEFLGYQKNEAGVKILKLLIENKEVAEAKKGDSIKIILDKTPFYAESGGQVGDSGTISKSGSVIKVTDTQKFADIFIHTATVESGSFKEADAVTAKIDEPRRLSIMRNHTATHLLQAALRKVLGAHVQQQGSLVAPERLRFDFTHPQGVTKDQLAQIETLINGFIAANDQIEKHVMPIAEAKKSGALAFFAEKYGETVRVVSIDGYSKEFCGGTHLNKTGEIISLKITGEGAIAQGIRRIEAVTGTYVQDWQKEKESQEQLLRQSQQLKEQEKQESEQNFTNIKNSIDAIIKESTMIADATIVRRHFKDIDPGLLRRVSDLIKQKVRSAVIILTCEKSGNAHILIAVTEDLIKKDIKADEIVSRIAPIIDGSGGGRAQMAQAGSKNPAKLPEALKKTESILKELIEK
ncbi:MAG: alanine--tRNA ligase [Candidatus Omnitrophota bacterium]